MSFSFDFLDEAESSNLTYFINSLDEDDYAYLPIFKKLEDRSHMHIGKSFEINISIDPTNPKIVYVGDVLVESKREKAMKILKKYAKVFHLQL